MVKFLYKNSIFWNDNYEGVYLHNKKLSRDETYTSVKHSWDFPSLSDGTIRL